MRKAFTMLELVFVLVIIGIIAAVALREAKTNPLREAATQIISHIRYTQHLAMVDDKYGDNTVGGGVNWYRKRWQLMFANTNGSANEWSYMIYSDEILTTGTPNKLEHAVNPLDKSKYLSGGYSVGNIAYDDSFATKRMNLGKTYNISSISSTATCKNGAGNLRISFDHLGRPMRGALQGMTTAYPATDFLVLGQCVITLTHDDGNTIQIAIEPETGYTHILEI